MALFGGRKWKKQEFDACNIYILPIIKAVPKITSKKLTVPLWWPTSIAPDYKFLPICIIFFVLQQTNDELSKEDVELYAAEAFQDVQLVYSTNNVMHFQTRMTRELNSVSFILFLTSNIYGVFPVPSKINRFVFPPIFPPQFWTNVIVYKIVRNRKTRFKKHLSLVDNLT